MKRDWKIYKLNQPRCKYSIRSFIFALKRRGKFGIKENNYPVEKISVGSSLKVGNIVILVFIREIFLNSILPAWLNIYRTLILFFDPFGTLHLRDRFYVLGRKPFTGQLTSKIANKICRIDGVLRYKLVHFAFPTVSSGGLLSCLVFHFIAHNLLFSRTYVAFF